MRLKPLILLGCVGLAAPGWSDSSVEAYAEKAVAFATEHCIDAIPDIEVARARVEQDDSGYELVNSSDFWWVYEVNRVTWRSRIVFVDHDADPEKFQPFDFGLARCVVTLDMKDGGDSAGLGALRAKAAERILTVRHKLAENHRDPRVICAVSLWPPLDGDPVAEAAIEGLLDTPEDKYSSFIVSVQRSGTELKVTSAQVAGFDACSA
ncbi:hypothetical protein [Halovulum sp. GXIMD14793]